MEKTVRHVRLGEKVCITSIYSSLKESEVKKGSWKCNSSNFWKLVNGISWRLKILVEDWKSYAAPKQGKYKENTVAYHSKAAEN